MGTIGKFTNQDKRRFDDAMNALLEFTNERYPSCVFFEGPIDSEAKIHRAQRITLDLWDHQELIDDFIAVAGREALRVDVELVRSWKHRLRGPFFCMETQGDGALLMKDRFVFKVRSFDRSWESLSPYAPDLIYATLIPFEDSIVTDGFVVHHESAIGGPGLMRVYSEFYKALGEGVVNDSGQFIKLADVLEAQRRKTGIDQLSYQFLCEFVEQMNWQLADPMFHYKLPDRVKCA